MAKNSTPKSGTSRIRFIMLEAEVENGDLSEITSAIQNALKAPSQAAGRIGTTVVARQIGREPPAIDAEVEVENAAEDEVEAPMPKPKPQRSSSDRKPPSAPEVIDIDLKSAPSLKDFAQKATVKSDVGKFLLIAAYLKEHRGIEAVTASHIYTGFRHLGWSTAIKDFGQPLRDLKGQQLFTSPSKGHYAINHLGLDRVEKMKNGGE
jgi:hypothetical protein